MSKHQIAADNFVQANMKFVKDINVIHNQTCSDVTFSIDQTRLLSNGIVFASHLHPRYMAPVVINTCILDTKNINESFFYLASFIQNEIDNQILNSRSPFTFVKFNVTNTISITGLYGTIQYLKLKIRFGNESIPLYIDSTHRKVEKKKPLGPLEKELRRQKLDDYFKNL